MMKVRTIGILMTIASLMCCSKGKKAPDDSKDDANIDVGDTAGHVLVGQLPADAAVDTAAAFTVKGGEVSADSSNKRTVKSGQISLEIPSETALKLEDADPEKIHSQVVVVFKDNADPLETFDSMQFVAAPTAGDSTLLALPTEKSKSDSVDLGEIQASESGFVAGTTISSAVVDVPEDALAELAKADDSVRMARNAFANTNNETGENLKLSLAFFWNTSVRPAINEVIAADVPVYDGWGPDIHTNRADMSLTALCLAPVGQRKYLKINIPSPGVITSTDPLTYATGFDNNDAVESAGSYAGRRNCGFNGGQGCYKGLC